MLSPRCSIKVVQKEDICPQVSPLVSATTKMPARYFYSVSLAELLSLHFSNGNTRIYLVWLHIYFLADSGVLRDSINALHCLLFVLLSVPFSHSSSPGTPDNIFSTSCFRKLESGVERALKATSCLGLGGNLSEVRGMGARCLPKIKERKIQG